MARQRPPARRSRSTRGRQDLPASSRQALPTVEEVSAGGLVLDHTGSRAEEPSVALIARRNRHGRLLWSIPKGHIEAGESLSEAAVREVEEETGIRGRVLGPLGTIDYTFVASGRRVHKTVHLFLLQAAGGQLSDADVEVVEVAWVPLGQVRKRLAYDDEQRLVDRANRLLAETA